MVNIIPVIGGYLCKGKVLMIKLLIVACVMSYCSFSDENITFNDIKTCNSVAPILAGMQISDLKSKHDMLSTEGDFLFICNDPASIEIIFTSSERMAIILRNSLSQP